MRFFTGVVQRYFCDEDNIQRALVVLLVMGSFGTCGVVTAKEVLTSEALPGAATDFIFSDDFERTNADSLGSEWVDCHTIAPDSYEPLGVYDGGVVVPDPYTRSGNYGVPPLQGPAKKGQIFPGIGCAYIDTVATTVSVKIVWSGNHGLQQGMPILHVEATPLLYITPSNPRFGFGAWISELAWTLPVVLVGYIGSPPEAFEVIASAVLPKHETGTPTEVELRAEEPGVVSLWVDGKQVMFDPGAVATINVDPTMINSTLHGIAVDAHYVAPQSNIPTVKGIEAVTIQNLD